MVLHHGCQLMSCGARRIPGAGAPGTSGARLSTRHRPHRRRKEPPRVAKKRNKRLLWFISLFLDKLVS